MYLLAPYWDLLVTVQVEISLESSTVNRLALGSSNRSTAVHGPTLESQR